jgi:hypothetical protein
MGGTQKAIGALLCLILAGCAPSAPTQEQAAPTPVEGPENVEFELARAVLDKPCTLISIRDAQALTGRPFYETIGQNRVEGGRTRCTMAVGEGGVNGVIQLDIYFADQWVKPEVLFEEQCQKGHAKPPTLAKTACVTPDGAYAALMGDAVIVALVRRDPGQANKALSLRLLDLVSPRVEALTQE